MKELNQSVFYTTAQVTELVELSDQNVRKYVRLLEDREYEVAKDEHNRRLFSANDILVLRALIKKAKKPGHTLESAADEIIDEVGEIISGDAHYVTPNNDNDEVREMFSHVITRLDAIQEENRDLKYNIRNLVERLERYDADNAQRYIGYVNALENNDADQRQGSIEGEGTEATLSHDQKDWDNAEKDDTEDGFHHENNVAPGDAEPGAEEKDEQGEKAPSVSESPGQGNIDMNAYGEASGSGKGADERATSEEQGKSDVGSREKGGFLDGLFRMFRK
ncbi:hypothetical protein [Lacicoccus alkaliphilus]|uniref:DNA-binding transcriptional regulator, MerR family n=1 Tax=Lacicoccus alkaliphilus DSM 16010 TaxID=1123231 RepID=A0A1M7E6F9_9BACL|nr:hypothetical protein [Salinicoccus alkaliphilus]SHL87345.1 DNA-binding transcriptional regulator, MerR family [Salinicoccus alkaliphilus DSM 16010]